jgi:flagellin FlaB
MISIVLAQFYVYCLGINGEHNVRCKNKEKRSMYGIRKFHKNESGQTALETAIILIAFVVVASVFAFTILSAGSASTTRGEQAIYSGLEGVQSSMQTMGTVLAEAAGAKVDDIRFTVQLAAGGGPVNMNDLLISYRDAAVIENLADADWAFDLLSAEVGAADLLEEGERFEITVTLPASVTLAANQSFTLEIKPPTGAVLQINKTTPAALSDVMELR